MNLFDSLTAKERQNLSEFITSIINSARKVERDRCINILKAVQPQGGRAWTEEQSLCYEVLEYAISFINSGKEINNEVSTLL